MALRRRRPSLGGVRTTARPALVVAAVATGWGTAHLPAGEVGVLMELGPASGVRFGWLLLSEVPTTATLVGGALILVAGALVVTARRDEPVPATHPEVAGAAG
jgi:drug/metabolite transporter (DMT)-like permease